MVALISPLLSLLILPLPGLVDSQAIDPNSVPSRTRDTWCTTQKSSCPLLCLQSGSTDSPDSNDCDPTTLSFSCVCSNGLQPNASEYSQTIPYFECTETANQCVNNCGSGNDGCVTQCRTAQPCGAQDPKRVNITTTAASTTGSDSSATASASETNIYAGFGGPEAPDSTSSSDARSSKLVRTTLRHSEPMGLLLMFGGSLVGFALVI